MTNPSIVISDIHLGHRACADVVDELSRLVAAHPGHDVIFNGDTFNLSCDPPDRAPAAGAAAMLAAHPPLVAALGAHLRAGFGVTLIPGNHDATILDPGVRDALLAALGCDRTARLEIQPWFVRRGGVHIEHGHLYDPPNGPSHPLIPPTPATEPVGIQLTRRFVGPWDCWDTFADQWTGAATSNGALMIRRFGWRAGPASAHYCGLLVAINAEVAARRGRYRQERAAGDAALPAFAAEAGVPVAVLRTMLARRPPPLHERAGATFLRFGFDALLALLSLPVGAALVWRGAPLSGGAIAVLGLGYLVAMRHNLAARSANHMPDELREGAALVRAVTNVPLVIFGHTHREEDAEGYLNLGAFGDRPARARTYVRLDEHGHVERRQWPAI